MNFETDDLYLGDEWPISADINEVFEMTKVLRGHEIYSEYRDRLHRSGVEIGKLSARQLCYLVLEDMHFNAGLNVTIQNF